MRLFAVSDIHIDYDENRRWLHQLSRLDYQQDVLILAGDVSDSFALLVEAFAAFRSRFWQVVYVPGNHELWVHRNGSQNSLEQFQRVRQLAGDYGLQLEPVHVDTLSIVPLLGWYDYSFGQPSAKIFQGWLDYTACKWPAGFDQAQITSYFVEMNEPFLTVKNQTIISFSHFLPRIDLMPSFIPLDKQTLYPVLGSARLEQQIRRLGSTMHIYGHSHVNVRLVKDQTIYINNAFGYPHETRRTAKELFCVYEH